MEATLEQLRKSRAELLEQIQLVELQLCAAETVHQSERTVK